MKLKSLLKVVTATKYTVIVPDRNFYNYNVDYCADFIGKQVYDTFTNLSCKIYIPQEIMNREVKFIHAHRGELNITVCPAKN